MTKKKIETQALYRLCNNKNLFTCGTNSQYDKMIELAKAGVTQNELAYILYICSDHALDAILGMIAPFFTD